MTDKMMAQIYYRPLEMKFEQVPIPVPKDNEVLMKVKACGICGSDLAYFFGRSPLETEDGLGPLVLGHEFSGEIVDMGKMAAESGLFKIGDGVIANPVQYCNACPDCAKTHVNMCKYRETKGVNVNGAFAEYVTMRYTHIYKIPDGISYEEAALCEPLACGYYGVKKLDVKLGDFVVVFGPGPIGLMQLQLIKASGAGKVAMVGVLDYGLEKAKELGADFVINTMSRESPYYCENLKEKIKELSDGEMANRVIVPTSAKAALQGALEVAGNKATIVYFGLPSDKTILEVPLLDFLVGDKSLLVSFLAPFTWDSALTALKSKKIMLEPLITHRFTLDCLEEGIRFMDNLSSPDKIKSIVTL
jgi:threonine dehydrogenase-like Zn-dependent dehydrogenase